jgi:hypothetical protein
MPGSSPYNTASHPGKPELQYLRTTSKDTMREVFSGHEWTAYRMEVRILRLYEKGKQNCSGEMDQQMQCFHDSSCAHHRQNKNYCIKHHSQ